MKKFKSYTFWVALISAIILVIEQVCTLFGWVVNVGLIENIMLSICGVFVVLGIVTKTTNKDLVKTDTDTNKNGIFENEEILYENSKEQESDDSKE